MTNKKIYKYCKCDDFNTFKKTYCLDNWGGDWTFIRDVEVSKCIRCGDESPTNAGERTIESFKKKLRSRPSVKAGRTNRLLPRLRA